MPIIKSSEKDLRRTASRTQRNRAAKGKLRSSLKRVRAALSENQAERAQASMRDATPVLDRAVTKKILHKNAAARLKSRLMRQMKRLTSPASA